MTRRRVPGWLGSRWVVVPAAAALAATLWNGYAGTRNDGLVGGAVLGPDGRPAAGATVVLFERNVTTFSERARAATDAAGRFRFDGNRTHHAQLAAEKEGVGRSGRVTLRLWFRGQNAELAEPLVLRP